MLSVELQVDCCWYPDVTVGGVRLIWGLQSDSVTFRLFVVIGASSSSCVSSISDDGLRLPRILGSVVDLCFGGIILHVIVEF